MPIKMAIILRCPFRPPFPKSHDFGALTRRSFSVGLTNGSIKTNPSSPEEMKLRHSEAETKLREAEWRFPGGLQEMAS